MGLGVQHGTMSSRVCPYGTPYSSLPYPAPGLGLLLDADAGVSRRSYDSYSGRSFIFVEDVVGTTGVDESQRHIKPSPGGPSPNADYRSRKLHLIKQIQGIKILQPAIDGLTIDPSPSRRLLGALIFFNFSSFRNRRGFSAWWILAWPTWRWAR